jgi:signal transduction histidine kinase
MSGISKIPFSVSARTARLIGRENVSNAEAAVIELLKNSYDADAPLAKIIFDDDNLYIIDDGSGMTEAAIRGKWMVIGTDNKETDPQSQGKRMKSGAKGIGRFALDRLGKSIEMYTLTKGESTGLKWSVEWSLFEERTKTVDTVEATLETITSSQYNEQLEKVANITSDQGTILHIKGLRDDWSEKNLDKLYQALESLVPVIDEDSFGIEMNATAFPGKYGRVQPLVTSDYDYDLKATYDHESMKVSLEISRNEFDTKLLEKNFSNVFREKGMGVAPYDLASFRNKSFKKEVSIDEVLSGHIENSLLQTIGDFSFQLVFSKNAKPNNEDIAKYPYRTVDYKTRADWLKKFGGIRIYRDNFRVRPYGENGDDWLRLGERQAQSPGGPGQRRGGYKVRPNQVTGGVYISRLNNKSLQDKSSREGIVENDSFDLMKNIIKGIIAILEDDRNMIFNSLSNMYKRNSRNEQVKAKGKQIVAEIKANEGQNSSGNGAGKESTDALLEFVGVLESEGKEKDEEIKILRSLASAGLITAAAAHELKGFQNHLETRNTHLRTLVGRYVKETDMNGVRPAFNPFVLIDDMKAADKSISGWLDYALMPLRRDKRTRATFNLNDYFKDLERTWSALLLTRKITLNIDIQEDEFLVKLFPIDLDTIFNNLIINSIESFIRQSGANERSITISLKRDDSNVIIHYLDNGSGLDKSLSNSPEKVFLPQVTTKLDAAGNQIGTGMGMYLVKSVVDENNGSVSLELPAKGFGVLIELGATS